VITSLRSLEEAVAELKESHKLESHVRQVLGLVLKLQQQPLPDKQEITQPPIEE